MIPSVADLLLIAGISGATAQRNAGQMIAALQADRGRNGLDQPHRIAHFISQLSHESGGWRWDEEVWGPTTAQSRYEGRADLGNTQPGDGKRFSGRTGIQVTGRYNYRQFTAWVRQFFPNAPNFEQDPDAILLDPWEGLAPIWYWSTRNLNRYADTNEIETITRRINGGLNGYDDRLRLYTRAALVLLGYSPNAVTTFQQRSGLFVDGKSGPRTRAALHAALKARADTPTTGFFTRLEAWWRSVLSMIHLT
jgi:putative chitinase